VAQHRSIEAPNGRSLTGCGVQHLKGVSRWQQFKPTVTQTQKGTAFPGTALLHTLPADAISHRKWGINS